MNLRWLFAIAISTMTLLLTACGGNSFSGNDFSSRGPAEPEPAYYGKPDVITNGLSVKASARFLYRPLVFDANNPRASTNGLGPVIATNNSLAIAFAEFHIYDSSGNRIQQGETDTQGIALFDIPKVAGTYTLKVFSRAYNDYLKVSVLEDIYSNTPYSISKSFTITAGDVVAGTLKDISGSPVYAEANESISSAIEGGAFNIMYDILLANEYIRRNIGKNGTTPGTPDTDPNVWWVADKVTVYWKAGFNPYTYFGSSSPLSFYSPGERKLYILGGSSGDVRKSDTDHFDDSVILHEYGHFLEDAYGHSGSPGGSHTGNFIIDARLAWSEGWANYFQSAVLTGADAFSSSASESRLPTNKRYQYYVDTYGIKGSGSSGVNVVFNLGENGVGASMDNVAADPSGTGTFREVSISRTLYKSSRATTEFYDTGKRGGGVSFTNIWKAFSGEDNSTYNRGNPAPYSLRKTIDFPVPSSGLFFWLLGKNNVVSADWDLILSEEKQNKGTKDYAYLLTSATCTGIDVTGGAMETPMYSGDPVNHSNQQKNNDFYLYYHDGVSASLSMSYITSGNAPDLDLILYTASYVYFEDDYWAAGRSSPYIVKQSRSPAGASESINMAGVPAGYYILNVKINARNKVSSDMNGTSTYQLFKNGAQLCGTERP